MEKEAIPPIVMAIDENAPAEYVSMLLNKADGKKLEVKVKPFKFSTPYASVGDWAIPTCIGVYIFKPYFDGILKELAKDHYAIIKEWLKQVSEETRKLKSKSYVSSDSELKEVDKGSNSKNFSIQTQANETRLIKFIFDENLDQEKWNQSIDDLLYILDNHYNNPEYNKLENFFSAADSKRAIYANIDPTTYNWIFTDGYISHMIDNQLN